MARAKKVLRRAKSKRQPTISQILPSCASPTQETAVPTYRMPADTLRVCLRKPQEERPRPVKTGVTVHSLLKGTQTSQQGFRRERACRIPWISVRPTLDGEKLRPFRCSVVGCTQSTQGRTLHPLPRNPELRKIWMQRIGNPKVDPQGVLYVCGRHFSGVDYKLSPQLTNALGFACRMHLRPGALPTLCLPAKTTHCTASQTSLQPQATPNQSSHCTANPTAVFPTGTLPSELSGNISADVTHQDEEELPVACTVAVQTCVAQRTGHTQTSPDSQRSVRTQANVVVKTQMSQTCGSDPDCSDRDGVPPHHSCAALGTGRRRSLHPAFQRATPVGSSATTTSREDCSLMNPQEEHPRPVKTRVTVRSILEGTQTLIAAGFRKETCLSDTSMDFSARIFSEVAGTEVDLAKDGQG